MRERENIDHLSPTEQRALLRRLLTERQAPTLMAKLAAAAARSPTAPALLAEGHTTTYEALHRRAGALAEALRSAGVAPADRIVLCLPPSAEWVAALLGVLQLGAVAVPVDESAPSAWRDGVIADVGAVAVVTSSGVAGTGAPKTAVEGEPLAYVSCSPGLRAQVGLRAVEQSVAFVTRTLGLGPADVVWHAAPPASEAAVWSLLAPLSVGARVVLAGTRGPSQWLEELAGERVSVVQLASDALPAFVDTLAPEACAQLSALRHVIVSGTTPKRASVDRLLARLDAELRFFYCPLLAGGPVAVAHYHRDGSEDPAPLGLPARRPLEVLDTQLRPVPLGARGELYLGGDPTSGARLVRTGNLGRRLDDGRIQLLGTSEREAMVAGRRVSLPALQAELAAEPSVQECAVVARPGPSGTELVAYVVSTGPFSAERLRSWAESRWPGPLRPVAYVPLSRLPLLGDGQVDTLALGRVCVLDDAITAAAEAELGRQSLVAQAAAVIVPARAVAAPLHVADLIPQWRRIVPAERARPTASARRGAQDATADTAPAIATGLPLAIPPGTPEVLAEVLERAATEHAEQAIIFLDASGTPVTRTYRQLRDEARAIVGGLRALGLQPGDKVLFQLGRNEDVVALFWACVLGGFLPVPSTLVRSPGTAGPEAARLDSVWATLGRPLVVVAAGNGLARDGMRTVSIESLRAAPADVRRHPARPDDVALLLLTSGSTGRPKAVTQTHHALISRTFATVVHNDHRPEDVSFNWMPLDHVGGIVMWHLRDVWLGCRQVHAPIDWVLAEPLRWLDALEQHRATNSWAPNFAFALVSRRVQQVPERRWNLGSVRHLLNAGESIVPATARTFLRRLAPFALPADCMRPAWGMSETCSAVTYSDRFTLAATREEDERVDLGVPIPGFSVRIVDDGGEVVRGDGVGRLEVQGPSVTGGYFERPELTREAFSPDGWFRTGDLAFLRDGRLTLTGRDKDIIIVNGINYESSEIEAAAEEVEGVEPGAVACAVRDARSDTDQVALFFSTTLDDQAALVERTRQVRRRVVERTGLNPSFLVPVEGAAIPRTNIGKVQKSELIRRFVAGAFEPTLRQLDLATTSEHTVPSWFYRKRWRAKQPTPGAPPSGRVLLLDDGRGLGEALVARLAAAGCAVVRIERAESIDVSALVQRVAAEGPIDHLVHLWAHGDRALPTSSDEIEAALGRGLYSVVGALQGLAKSERAAAPCRLLVATSGAQPVGESEARASVHATLIGLVRTVRLEQPQLDARLVDLDGAQADRDAESLFSELCIARGDPEVAYRDRQRLIPLLQPVELAAQAPTSGAVERGGLYLVTGGLGGLGGLVAHALLAKHDARLVLVGRTPLQALDDDDARRQTLAALKAASAHDVSYEAVDICDYDRLEAAVAAAEARAGRPLDGIFHLAGEGNLAQHWTVASERDIRHETVGSLQRMLAAKVLGTANLYRLLERRPHATLTSFSSVNGIVGGATLAAYSAANSFQSAYSLARRRDGHLGSRCLSWTQWQDVGMSRGNPAFSSEAAAALGFHSIAPAQGMISLEAALARDSADLIIGVDASRPYMRALVDGIDPASERLAVYYTAREDTGTVEPLELHDRFGTPVRVRPLRLGAMPLDASGAIDRTRLREGLIDASGATSERVAPRTDMERALGEIFQEVLGKRAVDVRENFFDLGANSLLMVKAHGQIKSRLGVELSIVDLFHHTTIEKLAQFLAQARADTSVAEGEEATRIGRNRAEAMKRRRRRRGSTPGDGSNEGEEP